MIGAKTTSSEHNKNRKLTPFELFLQKQNDAKTKHRLRTSYELKRKFPPEFHPNTRAHPLHNNPSSESKPYYSSKQRSAESHKQTLRQEYSQEEERPRRESMGPSYKTSRNLRKQKLTAKQVLMVSTQFVTSKPPLDIEQFCTNFQQEAKYPVSAKDFMLPAQKKQYRVPTRLNARDEDYQDSHKSKDMLLNAGRIPQMRGVFSPTIVLNTSDKKAPIIHKQLETPDKDAGSSSQGGSVRINSAAFMRDTRSPFMRRSMYPNENRIFKKRLRIRECAPEEASADQLFHSKKQSNSQDKKPEKIKLLGKAAPLVNQQSAALESRTPQVKLKIASSQRNFGSDFETVDMDYMNLAEMYDRKYSPTKNRQKTSEIRQFHSGTPKKSERREKGFVSWKSTCKVLDPSGIEPWESGNHVRQRMNTFRDELIGGYW